MGDPWASWQVLLTCWRCLCAQRWLQEPAWSEEGKPDKLAGRLAAASSPKDRDALERLPMFCMETALNLHRWAELAYVDFGQKGGKLADEGSQAIKETTLQGVPSDADAWSDGEPPPLWQSPLRICMLLQLSGQCPCAALSSKRAYMRKQRCSMTS